MTQTSQTQAARCEAKQQVRQMLAAHGGDPKQEAIAATIDALIALNPTPNPADRLDLLFQPKNLRVVINQKNDFSV